MIYLFKMEIFYSKDAFLSLCGYLELWPMGCHKGKDSRKCGTEPKNFEASQIEIMDQENKKSAQKKKWKELPV